MLLNHRQMCNFRESDWSKKVEMCEQGNSSATSKHCWMGFLMVEQWQIDILTDKKRSGRSSKLNQANKATLRVVTGQSVFLL